MTTTLVIALSIALGFVIGRLTMKKTYTCLWCGRVFVSDASARRHVKACELRKE